MLVIFSDTHLSDGTTGRIIDQGAFRVFRDTLRDMAYDASWRADGAYRPIDEIQLVLLGDVFDVIRSTSWLGKGVTKPWDDSQDPQFVAKIDQITQTIIHQNRDSLQVLRELDGDGYVTIPPATDRGEVANVAWEPDSPGRHKVKVNRYYLVGNHDWFYRLPGPGYDRIRALIVAALGLANSPDQPFPHEIDEAPVIAQLCARHCVFARHGDIYDPDNYDGDRNRSSLGDAIVVELLARFPFEVDKQLGATVSPECVKALKEIDNVRPLAMSVLWIAAVLQRTCLKPGEADRVKKVWNELVAAFFRVPFVKSHRAPKHWATLLVWWVSQHLSMHALSRILLSWPAKLIQPATQPNYRNALAEPILATGETWTVVYGHTHVYELVPLDSQGLAGNQFEQIYINSGTWRPYHELAERNPAQHKFVSYHVFTILAFYNDGERRGRRYEIWNGVLDDH
jgi:hypothetical protein